MCVLSIKVPIQKKSGNLFNDPRTFLYLAKSVNFPYFVSLFTTPTKRYSSE